MTMGILESRQLEDVTILKPTVPLTFDNLGNLRECLKSMMEHSRKKRYLLDLSLVSTIDSAGIGCLVSAYKATLEKKGSMAILCQNEIVVSAITSVGLHRLIRIFETEEEAFSSLKDETADIAEKNG